MKTKRLYLKKAHQQDGQEADLVTFDKNGKIIAWEIFSEYLQSWLKVDLNEIKESFPSTYSDAEDKVLCELEYMEKATGFDVDFAIDQSRDDKAAV